MKVWIDIMSGDEMVSDSYPYSESFEGACLEVKSKLLTKNANEDFGIGGKLNSAWIY
jgi:Translationally controlled tumour protein